MQSIQFTNNIFKEHKLYQRIIMVVLLCIVTNILMDFSFTLSHNSPFYFSESLLFSSYWLLLLPLLLPLIRIARKTISLSYILLLIAACSAAHLVIYPALVWLLSALFCEHTFAYRQTLYFALPAYLIKTVIIYAFSYLLFFLLHKTIKPAQAAGDIQVPPGPVTFILVAGTNGSKIIVPVNDILYFSSSSPYIHIHQFAKKHLHSETLKVIETQLNGQQFVRIHKSCIVNLQKIAAIQSRQNGDYDITLINNETLRVSRTYAKNFKLRITELPQLTSK